MRRGFRFERSHCSEEAGKEETYMKGKVNFKVLKTRTRPFASSLMPRPHILFQALFVPDTELYPEERQSKIYVFRKVTVTVTKDELQKDKTGTEKLPHEDAMVTEVGSG